MSILIKRICPKCSEPLEITYYPGKPGKLSGPPEHCYPDEPAEWEPDVCPNCGREIEASDFEEQLQDIYSAQADAEYKAYCDMLDRHQE